MWRNRPAHTRNERYVLLFLTPAVCCFLNQQPPLAHKPSTCLSDCDIYTSQIVHYPDTHLLNNSQFIKQSSILMLSLDCLHCTDILKVMGKLDEVCWLSLCICASNPQTAIGWELREGVCSGSQYSACVKRACCRPLPQTSITTVSQTVCVCEFVKGSEECLYRCRSWLQLPPSAGFPWRSVSPLQCQKIEGPQWLR